ncbi:MAG: hypothetical protein EOP04_16375, partial [Proteobacteria bacterium]
MKRYLIAFLSVLAFANTSANAQVKLTSGVEFSNPQHLGNILSPVERARFTEQENKELQSINVFLDIDDKDTVYYVQPVRVAKWNEVRYTMNMGIHERVIKLIFSMIDDELSTIHPAAVRLVADATTGILDLDSLTGSAEALNTIAPQKRAATVNALKLMQALLPQPYNALPLSNFEDALLMINDIVNKVPSVRVQLSLAFGFSDTRSKIFTKAQGLLPKKKFYAIGAKSGYTLMPNLGATPPLGTTTEDQARAIADKAKQRKQEYEIFKEIRNIKVPVAGTVVGLDLFQPVTAGWNLSSSDTKAGAGILAIEGDFKTSFPMSVDFRGKVECSFSGEIKRRKLFRIEQMPGSILMVDTAKDGIDSETGGIVDCKLYDSSNVLLSSDGKVTLAMVPRELIKNPGDDGNIARALNAQIEGHINRFNNETSKLWTAGTDLRDSVMRSAENQSNGYLNIPVPMEAKSRFIWENVRECRQVPRQGDCLRHGWKKGHGIKRLGDKWICKEFRVIQDEVCADIPRLIAQTYQSPVRVRSWERQVDFARSF